MYRQGLGDCFLLAFATGGRRPFYVLIDCGVLLGTPDAGREDAAGRREPPRRRPAAGSTCWWRPTSTGTTSRGSTRRARSSTRSTSARSGWPGPRTRTTRWRQPPAGAARGPTCRRSTRRRGACGRRRGRRRPDRSRPCSASSASWGGRPPLAASRRARLRARPRQAAALPHPGRGAAGLPGLPRPRLRARAAAGRGAAAALRPLAPGERGLREAARARRGDAPSSPPCSPRRSRS